MCFISLAWHPTSKGHSSLSALFARPPGKSFLCSLPTTSQKPTKRTPKTRPRMFVKLPRTLESTTMMKL
uniref:Uncharacterized protein n=1 Tax=Rhizophora mucronata TaxID=61149 RepID=A0A2P2MZB9_RHIMU